MKSPSWGAPSGDTENSLWVAGCSAEVESRQAGPKARLGRVFLPRPSGRPGRLYLQTGRTGRSGAKAGEGAQRALGARARSAGVGGDRRGAGHPRGAEGTAPQALTARGGIRAGGREAGAPHLRGGGGAAAAHGGAGGARRRRRARSYAPEPLGMRAGGRPGRARPGPARLGGDGSDGDGGKNSGGGAVRGRRRPHPPAAAAAAAAARLRLRSCCCSCSPAERGGRRRRHLPLAPASHHPRPVPLPLPLPLPGCSRLLLGAARVSHQTPRPQCSAAPRRADGGATAARTRPGPWARAGACAAPGPFRGGTEAELCLWARGRLRPRLPSTRPGSQTKCSRLASGRARHREVIGGRSFSPVGAPPRSLARSFLGLWRLLL